MKQRLLVNKENLNSGPVLVIVSSVIIFVLCLGINSESSSIVSQDFYSGVGAFFTMLLLMFFIVLWIAGWVALFSTFSLEKRKKK
jgi:uncharacterized membrane protein YciS (DUF1049 family)